MDHSKNNFLKDQNLKDQKKYWDKRRYISKEEDPNTKIKRDIWNKFKIEWTTLDIWCWNNIICKDKGIDISIPEISYW